jgi:hypothetical protein
MPRRRFVGLLFAIVAALTLEASADGTNSTPVDVSATDAKLVASAETRDVRVDVTAEKVGDVGGAPTAVVRVGIRTRVNGTRWSENSHRLKGPYFWHTVTGPRSLCRLDIRQTAARPRFRPHVVVQLLRSPSLGCGPAHRFRLA